MTACALALREVRKHFGEVVALDDVDLEIQAGEVHGLLGQNGSGKSTLVKILAGYHAPDRYRSAELWGRAVELPLRDPREHGLAVIHQDLALVPAMSVAENLGITTGFGTSPLAPISWQKERGDYEGILRSLGIELDWRAPVASLSPAERAAVAIARAIRELRSHPSEQLLILDEPTAYLGGDEADRVVALMRSVADRGSSVVFISHRLKEVTGVCDRVTVLRDGRRVDTVDVGATNAASLIRLMLGRELDDFYPPKRPATPGPPLLVAEEVEGRSVHRVSFELRAGEIVGVTGLVGMGQQELPYLLGGVRPLHGGRVLLGGERPARLHPKRLLEEGVVLVPANRQRDGAWLAARADENITLPTLGSFFVHGLLRNQAESAAARTAMERLGVVPLDPVRPVARFSGGNQQKVVLAKWLRSHPRVLLLDEPTQGVDAGAKREILQLVSDAAAGGAAVCIFSSDFEQVASLCHRVVVLDRGRIVGELGSADVTEQRILELCHAA